MRVGPQGNLSAKKLMFLNCGFEGNSWESHGLWQARPPCPSPVLWASSNSCPLSADAIQPSHPLLFPSPPALNLSQLQSFSNESALHIRCPMYWSFSINPSSEYSRLIPFRTDWFDLPAFQGTLKSLLQHYSLKASILWHSAFLKFQLSHPYMTTGNP